MNREVVNWAGGAASFTWEVGKNTAIGIVAWNTLVLAALALSDGLGISEEWITREPGTSWYDPRGLDVTMEGLKHSASSDLFIGNGFITGEALDKANDQTEFFVAALTTWFLRKGRLDHCPIPARA